MATKKTPAAPRGRAPEMGAGQQRTRTMGIRVTADEEQLLERAAAELGRKLGVDMPVSVWARRVLLWKAGKVTL